MLRDLPEPNSTPQAQNEPLIQRIISEIKQDKTNSIDFARFMALALYEPQWGYYTAGLTKLGQNGDFITAPELSPLFAQCMGSQCEQVFSELGGGEILEIGAGTGKMACDLLLFLEKKAALPGSYKILEISQDLKQRQQEMLNKKIPNLFSLIEWLPDWPKIPIKGVIIANEVVDALPVNKFLWSTHNVQEMRVTYDKHQFLWNLQQPAPSLLVKLNRLKENYFQTTNQYESEVCLGLPIWINKLSAVLKQGLILILDYGFSAREYYHPERCHGTFMCYYRQQKHDNPFILIGLQDMTASVDFSLLTQCAVATGLNIVGFTSQAAFLINNGLLHRVEECYNLISSVDINRQVYCLTSPNEMGELIKVIGMTRDYASSTLQGFVKYDKRTRL